jgi:hypothetical protein
MRTTVTIDDDIAVRLERGRIEQHKSFKEYLNEILRAGLERRGAPCTSAAKPFRTRTAQLGPSLVGEVHNIGELLAIAEGEDYR